MSTLRIIPPQPVQTALDRLTAAGHSAYIVGGCVRDALLGQQPHDWDCTTSARPEAAAACFRDYHVIETGLKHGTITVVIDKMPIEITTYRIDGSYADHRRPDSVTFTDRLEDDLARRDFTVNAMAYHPARGLIDCWHGAEDLAAGRIACVGDPAARFEEDGLRILRAMRFASVLGFTVAPETAAAVHEKKELLHHISAERICTELTKLLCGKDAERILTEFSDVIFTVLPGLSPMYGFDQRNPHHDYDVWTHTLKAVSAVPPEPILRWAALLHDAGKPHCFTEDERGGHFYGHAEISADIARTVLKSLKTDRKTYDRVLLLVRLHDMVWNGTEKQLKRTVRKIGADAARELLLLHRGDVCAQAAVHRAERTAEADRILLMLDELLAQQAPMTLRDLAVNGGDLLALGYPQGAGIGKCLNLLLDRVLDGSLPNTREALLSAAADVRPDMESQQPASEPPTPD
ncbi:MAG: HD domain-containing protein [Oscillospiraceae bacterium]|nr:HD domain-containing protein [Oscillospiraceae bacterium]